MAISAIRKARAELWSKRPEDERRKLGDRNLEEVPVPSQAYIIRQLKRPEEIKNLSVNNVSAVFGFASTQGDECSSDVVESKAITD